MDEMNTSRKRPLSDLKILDLTRVLSGPFATMILADMGASVIKIERPGTGDDSRAYGPFQGSESAYFMNINRNKKSLCLDLKNKQGKEVFLNLVRQSDVLVENFRPGTMGKMGLGYDFLEKLNPRLIFVSISGFGNDGPYSQRAAYDIIVQAMSGLMSITGEAGGEPTRVGVSSGDLVAALYAVIGTLMALRHREKTGEGQWVDIAMLDCQVSFLENAVSRFLISGVDPVPIGNRHPSIVPFESFSTRDSMLVVAVGNDELWKDFCDCIGRPDLKEDVRFKTNQNRNEHYDSIKRILDNVFLTRDTATWIDLLEKAGIPCSPINKLHDVIKHPQLCARDMFVEVDHPKVGNTTLVGIPVKLSKSPGAITAPAPCLGQHGKAILTELGYSGEEIEILVSSGAVTLAE